jgi:hypothetical protein
MASSLTEYVNYYFPLIQTNLYVDLSLLIMLLILN